MFTLSLTRLVAAVGGLALSLTAGAPGASAEPGSEAAVNTTCSYPQVVAAINAQSPSAGEQLNSTPIAQSFLQNFLASPPSERQQMLEEVKSVPEASQFIGLIQPVANTCHNY
jgi:hemophore-related protein